MSIGLVLAAMLSTCLELDLKGEAEGARDCYVKVINESPVEIEVAGAYRGLGNVNAANDWYRRAAAERPDDPQVRIAWGDLFRSVHQDSDAEALYQEALSLAPDHPRALLGLAQLYADRFTGPAGEIVERLLDSNPDDSAARLLAIRLDLELGRQQEVAAALDELLEAELVLGERLEALSLRATVAMLQGAEDNPWLEEIGAINPAYGEVYATAAHFYVITRRYLEAVTLYERAVATDPELFEAHSELGQNLLRVDRLDDARRHLETAYAGDPYNVLTVNTLRLLDMLDGYATVRDEHLIMRASSEESAALAPYVLALADRAATEMAPRYGYELERPMVVELYQHHDDFAVRTAGLPGIGILGATFGDVVVMDGPSAKSIEEGFDWASALWHELAHVVTLNATDNLVSRWFSEGVSVLEEWRFGPSARRSIPLSFLSAWQEKRLLSIGELDEGFIRPTYDGQIMVSYVQAGLVCQFVSERYPGGLVRMLEVYRSGGDNTAAITRGLKVDIAVLDAEFADYLDDSYGAVGAALEEFRGLLEEAAEAARQEDWAASLAASEAAIALYPGYVEPGSPYESAVAAARALTDGVRELALAQRYFAAGGRSPRTLQAVAEARDSEQRLAVLEALALTLPLAGARRQALGDAYMANARFEDAVGEYRAALSLSPHDRAAAHYELATALKGAGATEAARREVLLALEIAPRYSQALSLLLELQQ